MGWLEGVEETLSDRLDHLIADYDIPGVQVAVVEGRSMVAAAAGRAQVDPDLAMDAETLMQAASLSKPVFAAAVLVTAHRGELDLDAPLVDYLASSAADAGLAAVTARHCLSHTAGLGAAWDGGALKVHHEPGARFSYSGIGYEYLGRVMRSIWDEPVDAAIQRLVLDPVGVSHAVWRAPSGAPHVATGFIGREPVPLWPWPDARPFVSGSLYTTAAEYARFLRAVLSPHDSPFPPDVVQGLHAEAARFDSSIAWSLGLGLQADGSVWHWGENPGFHSFAVGYPDSRRGVVVMTNSGHGVELYRELIPQLLPGAHDATRLDDDPAWVRLWQLGQSPTE